MIVRSDFSHAGGIVILGPVGRYDNDGIHLAMHLLGTCTDGILR